VRAAELKTASDDEVVVISMGPPQAKERLIRLLEPNRLGMVIRDMEPEEAAQQVAALLQERLAALQDEALDIGADFQPCGHRPRVPRPATIAAASSGEPRGTQRAFEIPILLVGSPGAGTQQIDHGVVYTPV
jgi:hypothetical protein